MGGRVGSKALVIAEDPRSILDTYIVVDKCLKLYYQGFQCLLLSSVALDMYMVHICTHRRNTHTCMYFIHKCIYIHTYNKINKSRNK